MRVDVLKNTGFSSFPVLTRLNLLFLALVRVSKTRKGRGGKKATTHAAVDFRSLAAHIEVEDIRLQDTWCKNPLRKNLNSN
jgi:hypothetical protein